MDGTRIDDHLVVAGTELEDGTVVPVELKIGQHVDVQHDGNLVASQIRVNAEVEGPVASVDMTGGTLTVLGQTISINSSAAAGPVTIFDSPYTQLSDVKVNDIVQIHALIKIDASGKATLQATRVEKKTPDAYNRVHGIVTDLSTSASTFKLGTLLIDYSTAKLLPAGVVLANGTEVHVAIPVGLATTGVAVKAQVIKVEDHKAESQGKEAELGGAISALDASAKTLTINGTKVDASAATFDQSGKSFADLKLGSYVVVKGVYGSDQTLKATNIVIRGIDNEKDTTVEIHGSILNFISNANFTLRGLTIDASSATMDPLSCAGITQLANDMQIEVLGSLTAAGSVKAAIVKCEKAQDGQSVIARMGVVSKVDATKKTFTLTTIKESITVQWSDKTLFVRVDATSLDAKTVAVEGIVSAGVLQAAKVTLASK